MTRALVVGYGSIGQRHARVLHELRCEVGLVSQQTGLAFPTWNNIHAAVAEFGPDYVIIANATAQHFPSVATLAETGFSGKLLVEKPAAATDAPWPELPFAQSYVAYNLRFHPVLQALKSRLNDTVICSLSAYCGQHLSTWRPDRDWRTGYSTSTDKGGGVLRDLSHELDYTLWLLGSWSRVAALGGNLGILGIDADEAWSILIETTSGAIGNVLINYLDRPARRRIIITTKEMTLEADFVAGTLRVNDQLEHFETDRDATYVGMHRAVLKNDTRDLCTLVDGLAVGRLIASVEAAQKNRSWITA